MEWEQLYALVQAGVVAPDDLVWNPQLPDWLPAAEIPGLFPAPPVPAPPVPGVTQAAYASTPAAYAAVPQPRGSSRRPSWLLPVLIPVVAVVIVGAGLGSYLALRHGGNADSAGTDAVATSSTQASSQNEKASAVEIKLPDEAKLVDTATWGEVPVNQVCVVLADGQNRGNAEDLAESLGGEVVGAIEEINAYQIETSGSTEADLQAALATARATTGVNLAVPNHPVAPAAAGEIWGKRISPLEDPAYAGANGEGYELVGVQTAWDYIRGSGMELGPVQVGVVDTGMYAGNGQFDEGAEISYTDSGAQLSGAPGITYSDGTSGSDPAGGHGTGVNTIIGADPEDGGPAGIASIMGGKLKISNTNVFAAPYGYGTQLTTPDPNDPTKVVWGDGNSYSFSDLAAIMAQVKAHSKVINLSWSTKDYTKTDPQTAAVYKDFFQKLHASNPEIIFVAAAGNDGQAMNGDNFYPGGFAIPNLITVGNTSNDGSMFKESNTKTSNFEVTLSAPGEQSVRGSTGQITNSSGGSSMAAPQVAAAAALLISINPALDAAQIKEILRVTARKNASGDPILAVDEAVFEVINMTREIKGLPALSRDEMVNQGVIDAVATPVKDSPNEYLVRAIVQALDTSKGADITITLSSGEILDGDTPRRMTTPGEVGWLVRMDDDKGNITVHRQDSKAGSRISLEKLDINGHWEGTLTFGQFELPEAVTSGIDSGSGESAEGGLEGCDLSFVGEVIARLVGRPFPMLMDITADEQGKGTAVMTIDMSAFVAELAAEYPDMEVSSSANEPQTLTFTYSGDTITFQGSDLSGSGPGEMKATVQKEGETLVMVGTLSGGEEGFTMVADWTLTKQ
ncbi:MAG TPA: S8 family serine peptidase, partial [Thermoleophilia bacterium]|nr:S8 family serine peptidase [Thermoleophilia bacterium]